MIGAEVRELKEEFCFLRDHLHQSCHNEEFLKSKLAYYQQREEDKFIDLSINQDNRDSFNRKRKYSTYAAANFSPNFRRSFK